MNLSLRKEEVKRSERVADAFSAALGIGGIKEGRKR